MDCPRCDSRIRQSVNYCPECGLYLEKLRSLVDDRECPRCNEAVPSDSPSCPECGLAMAELEDRLFGEDPNPPPHVQGSGDANSTAGPPPEPGAPPSQPPEENVPPAPQGGGPSQAPGPQGPPPDGGELSGPEQPAPPDQQPPPDGTGPATPSGQPPAAGNGPPAQQPPPTDGSTLTDRLPLGRLAVVAVLLVLAGAVVLSSGVLDSGSTPTAELNDGFLQSEAEQTGQQASQQVTNRLEVLSATGIVRNGQVTIVNLTVARAPGSAPIDLGAVNGTWIGPQGSETMAWDDEFRIHAVADDDGSIPVLNDAEDRAVLTVYLGDGGVGQPLPPGASATVRFTTPSNGTAATRLAVPESLQDGSTVQL